MGVREEFKRIISVPQEMTESQTPHTGKQNFYKNVLQGSAKHRDVNVYVAAFLLMVVASRKLKIIESMQLWQFLKQNPRHINIL